MSKKYTGCPKCGLTLLITRIEYGDCEVTDASCEGDFCYVELRCPVHKECGEHIFVPINHLPGCIDLHTKKGSESADGFIYQQGVKEK
jgi:hypothetical protein